MHEKDIVYLFYRGIDTFDNGNAVEDLFAKLKKLRADDVGGKEADQKNQKDDDYQSESGNMAADNRGKKSAQDSIQKIEHGYKQPDSYYQGQEGDQSSQKISANLLPHIAQNYSTRVCFLQPAYAILSPQEVEIMTNAYILIEALPGKAIELTNIIKGIKGVKTVHLVTGPYDVITFVEASDLKSLGEMIVKKIQSSGSVARTLTCITVEQ